MIAESRDGGLLEPDEQRRQLPSRRIGVLYDQWGRHESVARNGRGNRIVIPAGDNHDIVNTHRVPRADDARQPA